MDRGAWQTAVHGVAKRRTRLSDWAHTPTISRSLLKFMSIELVMPSNYILCLPLLLLPSIFPSIKVFSDELALHIRWPKYWSFSFSISSSRECSGLISFRIDWFELLAAQGTLRSLEHHNLKAPVFWCSAFFTVQLSHLYVIVGKILTLTIRTFVSKVMSLRLICYLGLSKLSFQGASMF